MYRWICVLLLGVFPLMSWSQLTTSATRRYQLYNEANGLGRHSILDVVRDTNGFYWLATEKGIVRFDGANFTEINPPEPYATERVRYLYVYNHWLYVIYVRQGCVRLNLKNYSFETITDLHVTGVHQLSDKRVVIMDNAGNLYVRENDKLILRHAFKASNEHHPMYLQDSLFFVHVHKKGMIVLDARTLDIKSNLGIPSPEAQLSFSNVSSDLFFLGEQQLFRIHRDLRIEPAKLSANSSHDYSFISQQTPEKIILIDRNKTLYEVTKGLSKPIPLPGLENAELRKVIVHDSANIIVATNIGLLHVQTGFSPVERFSDIYLVPENELRIRRKILPITGNDIIFFGYSQNFRFQDKKLSVLTPYKAPAYDATRVGTSLFYTTEDNGLFRYDISKNTLDSIRLENPNEPIGLYAIAYNPTDSILITGSQYALYVYHLHSKQKTRIALPFSYRFIQTLLYDSLNKRYWVGTDKGLICLDQKFEQLYFSKQIQGGKRPLDVTEMLIHSRTGQLWVAHRYGVEVIDPLSFKTVFQLTEHVFKNPIVAGMVEDNNGNIWISTFEELLAFNLANRSFIRLGSKNNLSNQEYNFKSFAKLPDGRLIFGGVTGYDIIDPNAFSFNRSSDIGILTGYDLITKENTILKFPRQGEKISFNIDTESLRLYLSAKNQLNSRNYTYEYKFNDEGWNTMKDASYLNIYKLDPGRYTLQFRAIDEYGSLITFKPMEINATVVFYKNRFFIWSLFLLTIVLIVLVVLNEVRRKYRENQLKEQISMDLHDEVGTILTRALMTAQSTGISQKDERIRNYLSEALYSLRVYINTMNKSSFSLYQLADELKEMIHQTYAHTSFDVKTDIHIQSEKLISSEKYRDMKLCLYEILNNILKHAHASTIDIRMDDTSQHVRFIIKDNGRLTHIDKLENKGNGIRNIRKRLKKYGGIASFTLAENGHGLLVSMICPL
jgi:signal transduction histidine kinase/ligand-binding sensor domain-containing protein